MSWWERLRARREPEKGDAAPLDAYDGAVLSVERAWHGTSLLARTHEKNVIRALQVLAHGNASQIGDLLTELAHESYSAAAPLVPGLDAEKVTSLSAIVMGLIAQAGAAMPIPRDPEMVASALLEEGRCWIRDGAAGPADLTRIGRLVGGDAGVRSALVAPLAPAAATLRCIARASAAQFAFRGAADKVCAAETSGV